MVSDSTVQRYEGLVRRMAFSIAHRVEVEDEDLVQLYRVKAWRALESYRPDASRLTEYRYVLMCLKNYEKDVLAYRRRGGLLIEDLLQRSFDDGETPQLQSRDAFEAEHLSSPAEEVFREVEEEGLELPNTLSALERWIVVLLYRGASQAEVTRQLCLEKNAMTRHMRKIRLKLGDWSPAAQGAHAAGSVSAVA